jgi:lipid II:glycine glycyltransferase (peptidoglycan interpeptide bridge formation enzyme)
MMENTRNLAQKMPGKIKLWVARLDGKVISGALIFYWNKSVVYYHGANHREYFSHRAANLVQNEIIKDAAQADLPYETYDFGPSGISDGVLEFKRRFGGDAQPVTWWFYTHPLSFTLQRIRARLSG